MNNLLPVLKNRQEFNMQKKRGMFVEELFINEHSPILMYGEDKGEYVTYSQSQGAVEDRKIKDEAIRNLENLNIDYDIQEMGGAKIMMCQHEYAAEKILDKTFMKKIGKELGSSAIVVGIPMKGFMAVVAKGKGEANLYGAVLNQYKNPETYPISNSLYYVVDGEIEMLGGNNESAISKGEDEVFEIIGKNDNNGKLGFIVKVGHKREDELANQIQKGFQNVILHGMKDSNNFNGKIDFYISPKFNELTSDLEGRIQKMAKNISERGAVQIMEGLSGEGFKVRFFHGDNKLIAETVITEPIQLKNKMKKNEPTSYSIKNKSTIIKTKPIKKSWWKFW